MANYIPFENLEVGKTYYFQSGYWHKVLGKATVTSLGLTSGSGMCDTDWNPNSETGVGSCVFRADDCWMWDEMPTEEEQIKRQKEGFYETYVPPRELEGVRYSGRGIPNGWKEKLDELIENLKRTFATDTRFKEDRRCGGYFIWESKLNYKVGPLLIRGNGTCDRDSIRYVEFKGGFDIHAGEHDSCGWLTGVIEESGSDKRILYG